MNNPKELWFHENEWDYDWRQVFGYAGGPDADSNSSGSRPEAAPLGTSISTEPFGLEDVSTIIGYSAGERDERDWIVMGQLKDGRFFSVVAGCDYTGWDCQAGGHSNVALTLEDIIRFGLTPEERERLGLEILDEEKADG